MEAKKWLRLVCFAVVIIGLLLGTDAGAQAWPRPGTIAGGFGHTVGLKSGGTVVAVGDSSFGMLNVGSWTGIVQVAAGVVYTIGLKSDGTVVGCGYYGRLQLDVGLWTDIVQVAAGNNHTVGLKSDGTVVAVGSNAVEQLNVDSWIDIVQVAAGYDHTVGLKSGGTVVAVGRSASGQLSVGSWTGIVQVAAGESHTVGLKSDRTVVAVGYPVDGALNVGSWTDIVQVAAGGRHTVGLKSDGTVVAVGDDTYGQLNVGSWSDIVQIAAGSYHTVGLKSDGTVVATGWNNNGQLSVDSWYLGPNHSPVLAAIGDKSASEGELLQFTLSATDPDGDNLIYSASNLPTGATFDQTTGTFSWTPGYDQAAAYPNVIFTVTDDASSPLSASETITITVGNVNRPPVLSAIGNKAVNENELLQFTVLASDPDGDIVAYSISNVPDGATFDTSTGVFSWTPGYDQAGSYNDIRFIATDNGDPVQTASEAVTITVGNVNRPPVLDPIGDKVVSENELLEFTVTGSDPDGDGLVFSAANLPEGASFNAQKFSWTPTYAQAAGTPYSVEFTVSDTGSPIELATKIITITVNNVNRAPVFSPIGSQSLNEGERLQFYVSATDYDGDTITYSTGPLPAGAWFDAAARKFTWIPGPHQAGNYVVRFYATDPGALQGSLDVGITVGHVPTFSERINRLIWKAIAHSLPRNMENCYLAHLKKVGRFFEDGKNTPAINQLNAFVNKVSTDMSQGGISTSVGDDLITEANGLLLILEGR